MPSGEPQAGTLLPASALTAQPMPRTTAATPAQQCTPARRPKPHATGERAVRCRGRAAGDNHARHAAADSLTVHPSPGHCRHRWAHAAADSGPAHKAMRPQKCCGLLEEPRRVLPRCGHPPGVSYWMTSAVAAPGTALPSVRGPRPAPAAPCRGRRLALGYGDAGPAGLKVSGETIAIAGWLRLPLCSGTVGAEH
jgi:hypothetical protein